MALSNKTVQELAKALASDVIKYIHEDERYAEFIIELISDGIQNSLGNVDEELKMELAFCIMERIYLTSA